MLSLSSILLFSQNPDELVTFYQNIFKIAPTTIGGEFRGFKLGTTFLIIGPHENISGRNITPERIMFNLETDDVEGEYMQLKEMGVTVIQEPYSPKETPQMSIATFEDLDGNYFQLTTPM